jgi:hydrogenase nickel incorporation protein HypB
MTKMRVVEIAGNLMLKNDAIARRLRDRFAQSATLVVNLLSSPGSGKTTLLEKTLHRLAARYSIGVLVGDQATENDAARLATRGVDVRQITTGAECRLDADMIAKALDDWHDRRFDLLLIENVGNLICPAEYDLGEDLRAVLFSVTEGEDKPLKYPLAFNSSQVVVITKIDIAQAVGYDRAVATASIRQVNPQAPILELSARSGVGMDAWFALLEERMCAKSAVPAP